MLNADEPTQTIPPFGGEQPSAAPGAEPLPEPVPAVDIRVVDVGGVIDNPSPPPAFCWEGFVPRGHVCLLSGHGGCGKSALALQMAVAVAMGLPLLGRATTKGRALFFSGEDAAPMLRHRLGGICEALDVNPRTLADNLRVLDATDEPGLYRETAVFGQHTVEPTPVFHRLAEILTEWQPVLAVIDNASDVFEGNENARAQVRAFVRALARLARDTESTPAVLLLTHTPKNAVGGRGESYSGSTSWHNSARARLSLVPDKNDAARVTLGLDKMNLAPMTAEPLRLARSRGGVLVLDEDRQEESGAFVRPEAAVMRLMVDFNKRGEKVSPEPTARNNAWKMFQQEPGFPRRRYRTGGALFAAMRQLERDGLIERSEYTNAHRKRYQEWVLTPRGLKSIGEAAPTAPTAPTYGVGAPGAPGADGRAHRAHICAGGVGEESARNVSATSAKSSPFPSRRPLVKKPTPADRYRAASGGDDWESPF